MDGYVPNINYYNLPCVYNETIPCRTYDNWDYNNCYNYYADGCYNTCPFVNFVDIEDFM